MRFNTFSSLLNLRQKIEYFFCKILDRIISYFGSYTQLKFKHNVLSVALKKYDYKLELVDMHLFKLSNEIFGGMFLRFNDSDIDVFNQIFIKIIWLTRGSSSMWGLILG